MKTKILFPLFTAMLLLAISSQTPAYAAAAPDNKDAKVSAFAVNKTANSKKIYKGLKKASSKSSSFSLSDRVSASNQILQSWDIGSADASVSSLYQSDSATNTVTADLYENGLLVIKGNGNALHASASVKGTHMPWYDLRASIKKVSFSSNVKVTDLSGWFYECNNLTSCNTLPAFVQKMNGTFYGCCALEAAPSLPDGLCELDYSFYNCTSLLTAPEIPATVSKMTSAFQNCSAMTKGAAIPGGVKNAAAIYKNCSSLTLAPRLEEGVENINGIFSGCTSIKETPELPSTVTNTISAFEGCSALCKAPQIPDGVVCMHYAFRGCTSLRTAPKDLPDSLLFMNETFAGCSSMTSLPRHIPASVRLMTGTFKNCSRVSGTITVYADPSLDQMQDCFMGMATAADCKVTVHYSSNCKEINALLATAGNNANIKKGIQVD